MQFARQPCLHRSGIAEELLDRLGVLCRQLALNLGQLGRTGRQGCLGVGQLGVDRLVRRHAPRLGQRPLLLGGGNLRLLEPGLIAGVTEVECLHVVPGSGQILLEAVELLPTLLEIRVGFESHEFRCVVGGREAEAPSGRSCW